MEVMSFGKTQNKNLVNESKMLFCAKIIST